MSIFLAKYFSYLLLFYLFLELPFVATLLPLESVSTALAVEATKHTIEFIGIKATLHGASFSLDNAVMLIAPECNGLRATLLFIAVLLAYPSALKNRIIWVVGSLIVLPLLNIARITFLAWVLRYHLPQFDMVHDYIVPAIMILVTLALFYLYTYQANASLNSEKRATT